MEKRKLSTTAARRRRIVRGVEDAIYCGVFLGSIGLCAALAEGLARLLGA